VLQAAVIITRKVIARLSAANGKMALAYKQVPHV